MNYVKFNYFCSDINECRTLVRPCPVGQDCINTLGSYACHCPIGYIGPACEISKLFHSKYKAAKSLCQISSKYSIKEHKMIEFIP